MTKRSLKRDAERGVVDSFRGAYRQATGRWLELEAEGEAPDFILKEAPGTLMGVEVTTAYYGADDAKGLWEFMRNRETPAIRTVVDPEQALIGEIDAALKKKADKDYGSSCILLIHLVAPLTGCADFESAVLPSLAVPSGRSPFSAIYLRLRVHDLPGVESVWWELVPERGRFAEVAPIR